MLPCGGNAYCSGTKREPPVFNCGRVGVWACGRVGVWAPACVEAASPALVCVAPPLLTFTRSPITAVHPLALEHTIPHPTPTPTPTLPLYSRARAGATGAACRPIDTLPPWLLFRMYAEVSAGRADASCVLAPGSLVDEVLRCSRPSDQLACLRTATGLDVWGAPPEDTIEVGCPSELRDGAGDDCRPAPSDSTAPVASGPCVLPSAAAEAGRPRDGAEPEADPQAGGPGGGRGEGGCSSPGGEGASAAGGCPPAAGAASGASSGAPAPPVGTYPCRSLCSQPWPLVTLALLPSHLQLPPPAPGAPPPDLTPLLCTSQPRAATLTVCESQPLRVLRHVGWSRVLLLRMGEGGVDGLPLLHALALSGFCLASRT